MTTTEAEASETHQETVETKAAGGGRTEYSSAHANKSEATTGAASVTSKNKNQINLCAVSDPKRGTRGAGTGRKHRRVFELW